MAAEYIPLYQEGKSFFKSQPPTPSRFLLLFHLPEMDHMVIARWKLAKGKGEFVDTVDQLMDNVCNGEDSDFLILTGFIHFIFLV